LKYAIIALGGNIGDVRASFVSALMMLENTCRIVAKSKLYQTPALVDEGAKPQPDYLNTAVHVVTSLSPAALLSELHSIEALHGRERKEHWGSRTLDLDLLDYEGVISNQPELKLPHPEIEKRLFVLLPLRDIIPDWVYPRINNQGHEDQGKNVQELITLLDHQGEQVIEGEVW